MPDMLVKLYQLPPVQPVVEKLASEGVSSAGRCLPKSTRSSGGSERPLVTTGRVSATWRLPVNLSVA